jgi:Amt family ammonium transporter
LLALAGPAFAQDAKIDTGDTAWMLMSTALVLLDDGARPRAVLCGMVRKKNVLATLAQSFAIAAVVSVLWIVLGYSLAFGEGNAWIGDFFRIMLAGLAENWDKPFTLGSGDAAVATTIPESVFVMFQMTFAIITPALIAGAFADRMKFSALLLFTHLGRCGLSPVAHWVWHPNGWIFALGALGLRGRHGGAHQCGRGGLVGRLVLGKRLGYGTDNMAPYNLTFAVIGAACCGWAGSASTPARRVAAAGARAWRCWSRTPRGRGRRWAWLPRGVGHQGQALRAGRHLRRGGGPRRHHPGGGFVLPGPALIIGAVAACPASGARTALKHWMGYDDSLDAFGVHGVCGIVGALLSGVFAYGALSATAAAPAGVSGGLDQLLIQLYAVVAVFIFTAVATFILLKIVDAIVGLRVSEDEEREGLDVTQHGERIA